MIFIKIYAIIINPQIIKIFHCLDWPIFWKWMWNPNWHTAYYQRISNDLNATPSVTTSVVAVNNFAPYQFPLCRDLPNHRTRCIPIWTRWSRRVWAWRHRSWMPSVVSAVQRTVCARSFASRHRRSAATAGESSNCRSASAPACLPSYCRTGLTSSWPT